MKEQTCCFIGCSPDDLPWGNNESDIECVKLKYKLYAYIEQAVINGYIYFCSNMETGFSTYCAEIVLELKKKLSSHKPEMFSSI